MEGVVPLVEKIVGVGGGIRRHYVDVVSDAPLERLMCQHGLHGARRAAGHSSGGGIEVCAFGDRGAIKGVGG